MNQSDLEKLTRAVKEVLKVMMGSGTGQPVTQLKVEPKMLHEWAKLGNVRISGMRPAIANILSSTEIVRGGFGRYGVMEAIGDDPSQEDLIIVKQNNAHTATLVNGVLTRRP